MLSGHNFPEELLLTHQSGRMLAFGLTKPLGKLAPNMILTWPVFLEIGDLLLNSYFKTRKVGRSPVNILYDQEDRSVAGSRR